MSSPITLSGFNNIDFSQVLNALMAQERIPVTQLTTQQTALSNQKAFFATFASKLAGLESAVAGLNGANAFDGRSATVSDPTAATVQVGGTTPRGSYSIAVSSLARAQVTGTSSTHTDRDSTIVASAGTLTIGGVAVTLTGGVTLDGLASAINSTPNIGVSASVVQNGGNFQLVLSASRPARPTASPSPTACPAVPASTSAPPTRRTPRTPPARSTASPSRRRATPSRASSRRARCSSPRPPRRPTRSS